MSNIKEDLAYRGELNRRMSVEKMPFEYGLLLSVRDGQDREVADRIRLMSDHGKFPAFFRLDLKDSDLEALYVIDKFHIQRERLLMGIVEYLEEDDVTPEQGYRLMPLLDLLGSRPFMIDTKRDVLLKGRLYFALKKIMPASDALRTYEHFVSYDQKPYHGASYNSFFERAISFAIKGDNPEGSQEDLKSIASCRHMIFIREEAEARRWIMQLHSIGLYLDRYKGQDNGAITHLGHVRAKHLMHWLETTSSVEAMQPFMSTKTIGSAKNAIAAFQQYVVVMTALDRINKEQPLKFDVQTPLTRHALKLVSRFLDKMSSRHWEELRALDSLTVDWKSICQKTSVENQEILVLQLPQVLSDVTHKARDRHFMGDLGL
ncbi:MULTISPECIES: hypothetical protein [Pseudomonas]|uniref:hypothetical protein n=1 Tax=Pseudomonas TaxID=286 RepID=UPI0013CE43FE|nr:MULTISPECIES: hypothetical protein [Pseudomonas]MBD8615125.1 hypothetical protein [Pseudomonas putida]MBD8681200.1 hypothetical protein [Pseudomonas sp. CFBP 13719]